MTTSAKKSNYRIFFIFCGIIAAWQSAYSAAPNAETLLKVSDLARGGGASGLVWDVSIHNTGAGSDSQLDEKLRVKATATASVAEILEPVSSKGSKMLQIDRNMWITKPGLKKPVPISPRQRLTGQAAIGDVAATNYAKDYTATFLREENVGTEPCYVLSLKALNKKATYDQLIYWVSQKRSLAVQVDFLSLSGKRIKSATFEYGNTVAVNGKNIPFVSQMVISDNLTDAKSTLLYKNIKIQSISASEFDVGGL